MGLFMKSTKQIFDHILETIGHIYFRPLMYGGTAQGVDLLLYHYHGLWAFITDQHEQFVEQSIQYHIEQDCDSASFATHYTLENPNATEQEIAAYVVKQWQELGKRLRVPIPYEKIERIYAELRAKLRSTNV
jgi:hypothetical protein